MEEIRRLYNDYGRYLDAGDADGYVSLFARDGKVRLGPVMKADGRDQIREVAVQTVLQAAGESAHVIGTPRVELYGDTATGECVWAAVSVGPDGSSRVLVGRHQDELVREDGRWRISRRRGVIDIGHLG